MKVQPLSNLEKLAAEAFSRTAAYDSEIANWFCNEVNIENQSILRLQVQT